MSFVSELGRRNVIRVGIAYLVASWLVLQVLDLVLENVGAPDWVMQAVMALLAIGLPIALLFAWAFEMTPDGIKRESEIDREHSITTHTGKKLDRLIIIVLIAVVAVMGIERTWFSGDRDTPRATAVAAFDRAKSIAVLPFADLSQTQDQQWFGDGLSEEILNALSRTPDLLVASRTSSFKYKGSDKDIREIAGELGVNNVLEGSIRRAGNDVRITAQLIRASDGFHVWSQNYDREMKDVIAIQENLAIEIARALETSIDPEALASMMMAGTRSIAAYEHYINGLALIARDLATGDTAYLLQAYEEFEAAREEDPGFSDAHAQAADFWSKQLRRATRRRVDMALSQPEKRDRFLSRIDPAIDTAQDEVSRSRYEAQLALVQLELRKTASLARRVVRERPNDSDAWERLYRALVYSSDRNALRELISDMMSIAEINPQIAGLVASASFAAVDPELAARTARRVFDMHPDHHEVVYQAHRALLWGGQVEEAAELLPLIAGDPWLPIARVRQACAEGDRERAEAIRADATPSQAWHSSMFRGDAASARAALDTLRVSEDPIMLASFLMYPHFDPSPYPELVAVLEREGIDRPPPVKIPFACPPD